MSNAVGAPESGLAAELLVNRPEWLPRISHELDLQPLVGMPFRHGCNRRVVHVLAAGVARSGFPRSSWPGLADAGRHFDGCRNLVDALHRHARAVGADLAAL